MYVQTYNETIFPLGNHDDWDVLDKVKTRIIFIPNPTKKSGQPKEKISTKGENIQSTKCGRCENNDDNYRSCQNPTIVKKNP